jgi:hypothetical protein
LNTTTSSTTTPFLAATVADVALRRSSNAKMLNNRAIFITEHMVQALVSASVFGWAGRTPRQLLDSDGRLVGTDFDLLSLLVPLAQRHAVIELPTYVPRREAEGRVGQYKVGTNQFGRIRSLVSNKDVFSFSVRIEDMTIVEGDDVGEPRSYMVSDLDGTLYGGWDEIRFAPKETEWDFLSNRALIVNGGISSKYVVHPNRWQSVWGAQYMLLKLLLLRLADEAAHWKQVLEALEREGVVPNVAKKTYAVLEKPAAKQSIDVATMEVKLVTSPFKGTYATEHTGQELADWAHERKRILERTLVPRVQFVTRADELAYLKHGNDNIAHWVSVQKESGYKEEGKRTLWDRYVYADSAEQYCALLMRKYTSTQQVIAQTVA